MSLSSHTPPPRPIMARAAGNGLWTGLYICALVLALGISTKVAAASLVVWIGTLAMPLFVYRMLRRSFVESNGALSFAELWAEGIASFFLGTLLPALVTYLCLKFLVPDFISDTINSAVEYFDALDDPQFAEMADSIRRTAEHNGLPSAVDVTAQLISFNIIAGTFLSLLGAVSVSVGSRFAGRSPYTK